MTKHTIEQGIEAIVEREMKDYSPFNCDYFERWLTIHRQVTAEFLGVLLSDEDRTI